jgi:MFS family permease
MLNNKKGRSKNFFYGWVIVGVSFITLIIVFGIRLSFTVFFVALVDEFGWSRASTSLIYSISMIVFAATSTLAGIALDRWGVRRTFGAGAVILAFGLTLSSQIQTLWQLTITYGGIASLGITILGLGLQASLIARWFRKRRGLAIGIAFAGTGIGSLLITPLVEYLISLYGWRVAYNVLAGFAIMMIPIIVLLLRSDPSKMNLDPDGETVNAKKDSISKPQENWKIQKVIASPAFWLLLVAAIGSIGPVRMLTVHQIAIMVDAGFERSLAALVVGFAGGITALSFVLSGALSDRINRQTVFLAGSISLVLAMFILNGLQSNLKGTTWLILYAVFLGIGEGSRSSMVTAVASDLFPGNALGAIIGTIGAAFGLGAAFFPWLAGWLFDQKGNYTIGFIIASIGIFISTISLFLSPKLQLDHNNKEI